MIIATAGHVDHGKTLLVHALTGVETDRLEEEQQRGLTIDLGFAYANFRGQRVGFVDVPGHIRFIHNMLAGISAVDFALLVVAADDGPMPQTLEHVAILDLLGISRAAVALTKIDRVSAARVAVVAGAIDSLLAGTSLAGAAVIPVSSVSGEGIPALIDVLAAEARDTETRASSGDFRMAIDRRFTAHGTGIIVTGAVFNGAVAPGDEVRLLPRDIRVRIRSIRRQDEKTELGLTGDRCALNVAAPGLDLGDIRRGDWLTTSSATQSDRLDACVTVLKGTRPLRNWTPVHAHCGASHMTGRIATLSAGAIAPGQSGLVQLVLSEPGVFWAGDRLIIRDQSASTTLAGGVVIDPCGPRRGRARPERLALLTAMNSPQPSQRLRAMLEQSATGLDLRRFAASTCLAQAEVEALLSALHIVRAGDHVIAKSAFEHLADQLAGTLADWHRANANVSGATDNQLRTAFGGNMPEQVWQAVIDELVTDRRLVRIGNRYQQPGHEAQLTTAEQNFWARVEPILAEDITRPPVMHDLAKRTSLPPAAVEKMLVRYVELNLLERPAANRFFLPGGIQQLQAAAVTVAQRHPEGSFTVRDFRDISGIGRNLSIEVLEYFDRRGVTVRMGDKRKLGRNA